jgi:HEAT repeat protein
VYRRVPFFDLPLFTLLDWRRVLQSPTFPRILAGALFLCISVGAYAKAECEKKEGEESKPSLENLLAKRVYSHLLIRDVFSAVAEAKRALERFPESETLQIAYFRALCEKGEEKTALDIWERYLSKHAEDRELLATLAWGILNKGKQSSQLPTRLNALLGICFTRDVKALQPLLEEMRSSSALARALAVHLSASYGDALLREELARLLREEKVWFVRLEVIDAIGRLKIKQLTAQLKALLIHPKTSLEERASALIALVNMYETIDEKELDLLIHSDRAALRLLACEIVMHLELKEAVKNIFPLVGDSASDVRVAALNACILLSPYASLESLQKGLEDPAFEIAITAAWGLLLQNEERGINKLNSWLSDPNPEHRRLAAAALSVSGPQGTSLAQKVMKESADVYVKMTLAVGLIRERKHLRAACKVLSELLSEQPQTLWMWESRLNPLFRALAPSRIRHVEQIPHYPKVVDQIIRLQLLSLLCIAEYKNSEHAVRSFLKSQTWGVTGAAAVILLEEGKDSSFEVIRGLLNDPEEHVRFQAALILATVGNDETALPILKEAYPSLNREMKLQILEAFAQIGNTESIPFLLSALKEPFQILRVAAACALIRCLMN